MLELHIVTVGGVFYAVGATDVSARLFELAGKLLVSTGWKEPNLGVAMLDNVWKTGSLNVRRD